MTTKRRKAPSYRIRHVLVRDGPRGPGWYVVDTSHRPARTVRSFDTRAAADAWLRDHRVAR